METGEKIKARRKELAMTAKKLAGLLGIHLSTMIRYESGQTKKIPVEIMDNICEALKVDRSYFSKEDKSSRLLVPVVDRIVAEAEDIWDNYIEAYILVEQSDISPSEDYIYFKVKGDDMHPVFIEGDLALVKRCENIESGSYAVVFIDGRDGEIKKVVYGSDYIELQPVNPNYPPRRFKGSDTARVRIYGLVKEIKRKFW